MRVGSGTQTDPAAPAFGLGGTMGRTRARPSATADRVVEPDEHGGLETALGVDGELKAPGPGIGFTALDEQSRQTPSHPGPSSDLELAPDPAPGSQGDRQRGRAHRVGIGAGVHTLATVTDSRMERFWDARAREDAYWFVDSRLEYGSPDEQAFWAGGEQALDRLLGILETQLAPDDVVIDIGCGIGRLTRPLAARTANVIAIDVSSEMLAEARRLNPDLEPVDWRHGDGESLRPVADASVDVCISHVVFRHIPDPHITLGYIREMGRVLRPGGFAAFELSQRPTPHRRRPRRMRERMAGLLRRAPRGVTADPWLGSHVELAAIERVAHEAGLAMERVRGEGTEFCAVLLRRDTA